VVDGIVQYFTEADFINGPVGFDCLSLPGFTGMVEWTIATDVPLSWSAELQAVWMENGQFSVKP
jgi:hypothetical protein